MTSDATSLPLPRTPMGPQIVNIALFAGALTLLGGLLIGGFFQRTSAPEISVEENRTLARFPEVEQTAVFDGSFALGVDEWIADHFPARAQFMAAHFWLESQRGVRAEEEAKLYAVSIDIDADLEPLDPIPGSGERGDEHGARAGDGVEHEDLAFEAVIDKFEHLGAPGETEDAAVDELDEGDSSITRTDGILVVDGRAMQLFAGGPNGSRHYAKVINAYADALPDTIALYSLIVPTAQTFYLPESYADKVRHEPPNIDATYAMFDPSVQTIDVVAALAKHTSEYIYFRTDHHWTGLGAYHAYAAFCKVAGHKPLALDSMKKKSISSYRGSLYSHTRDDKLHGKPDEVEYWIPPVEVSVGRYLDAAQKSPYDGTLLRSESNGYGVFLGGDHALMVVKTNNKTGRRALLVKNSYGNPFAVYLVAHYDEVVIVDYRKYDGSVLDLVDDHGISDVIILNGAITANARFHIDRLEFVLNAGEKVSKRKPKPADEDAKPE